MKKIYSTFTICTSILLISCAQINKVIKPTEKTVVVPAAAPIGGSTWKLNYISGPRITFEGLYPNKIPTINFDTTKSIVTGNTGCNTFNGIYAIKGDSLHFKPLATTLMACMDGGKGEQVFLNIIEKVSNYKLEKDTLWFKMGSVNMMRFIRQ
ncbi:META domain-containing protein [Rhizosphaericola mali]|uniref:META domain-containing protein n=1 Tax=Rhizosphaericola mali TaxID=2545455 RepID=A0A5P2G6B3_9BACT|nr:META domain-containing protein [Rhizosphaericola mali]QES90238.1 META domain-containing protein [Rhizosphaericola mali]